MASAQNPTLSNQFVKQSQLKLMILIRLIYFFLFKSSRSHFAIEIEYTRLDRRKAQFIQLERLCSLHIIDLAANIAFCDQVQQFILFMQAEVKAQKIFQGMKGSVEVLLTLKPQSNEYVLHVQLTDIQKRVIYFLKIDDSYIQKQDNHFSLIVEQVQNLYQILVSDFDSLSITQDGAITLELEMMVKGKSKKKTYYLKGTKQDLDPLKALTLQIQQLKTQVSLKGHKKDQQISELLQNIKDLNEESIHYKFERNELREELDLIVEQSNINKLKAETLQTQFDMIKIQLEDLKAQRIVDQQTNLNIINCLRNQINCLRESSEAAHLKVLRLLQENKIQKQEQFNRLRHQIEQYAQGLASINQSTEINRQEMRNQARITQENEDKKQNMLLALIKNSNPHRISFTVCERINCLSITKSYNEGSYENYIGAAPLAIGCVNIVRMRQVKTKQRYVAYGIGTINAFGAYTGYSNKQTLFYYSSNSYIYEFGAARASGSGVADGQTIQMQIDTKDWKVMWLVNNSLIGSAGIASHVQHQPLFLFINMAHIGDQVELYL